MQKHAPRRVSIAAAFCAAWLACACQGAPVAREPGVHASALKRPQELPARHRELLEAYGAGGERWEAARAAAADDPQLTRFLVDNLVLEMVRGYVALAGQNTAADNARSAAAFERAQSELTRLPDASAAVLASLMDVSDEVVSGLAARTLERIGRPALEPVVELLDSSNAPSRRRAAELLARLPHGTQREDAVRAALIARARRDGEWVVRAAAARTLGVRGARDRQVEPVRKALEDILRDPDPAVVIGAGTGLAALGDRACTPALIGALERAVDEGDLRRVGVLQEALVALSGERVERDLAGWRAWWQAHRDDALRARGS